MKIYFLPYHSQPGLHLRGSEGRFREVEEAIVANEWPYDNGDDPSFYAYKKDGAPLTWGVCRPTVRNAIRIGDVAVFFAFTETKTESGKKVTYRLSAVATVERKLDRRVVFRDPNFTPANYLNILIRQDGDLWRYAEPDDKRPKSARHGDWLWRIARRQTTKEEFDQQFAQVYKDNYFADGPVPPIADSYIVFSSADSDTCIARDPPKVAVAVIQAAGECEEWTSLEFRRLTVDVAEEFGCRNHLRVKNKSHRNVHLPVAFEMPSTEEGDKWRKCLIAALRVY